MPAIYRAGIWVSLQVSVVFIGLYAWRVAEEGRQLSEALAATEMVLAREQHLSALDGLAAAAAHELGTPLATIVLVASELERDLPKDGPMPRTSSSCASRPSAAAPSWPSSRSLGSGDAPFDRMPLSHLLEEVVAPHRPFGVAIDVDAAAERADEPVGRPQSRHRLWAREFRRERRRFRAQRGGGLRPMGRRARSRSTSPTTGPASRRR